MIQIRDSLYTVHFVVLGVANAEARTQIQLNGTAQSLDSRGKTQAFNFEVSSTHRSHYYTRKGLEGASRVTPGNVEAESPAPHALVDGWGVSIGNRWWSSSGPQIGSPHVQ